MASRQVHKLVHVSILIVMHDHIYNIKTMYKKNRRRKKGKRLLQLTKVNFTDVKKGLRAN